MGRGKGVKGEFGHRNEICEPKLIKSSHFTSASNAQCRKLNGRMGAYLVSKNGARGGSCMASTFRVDLGDVCA